MSILVKELKDAPTSCLRAFARNRNKLAEVKAFNEAFAYKYSYPDKKKEENIKKNNKKHNAIAKEKRRLAKIDTLKYDKLKEEINKIELGISYLTDTDTKILKSLLKKKKKELKDLEINF